jgi:hypothetical protein
MVLAQDSDIVLLDEPTTFLDCDVECGLRQRALLIQVVPLVAQEAPPHCYVHCVHPSPDFVAPWERQNCANCSTNQSTTSSSLPLSVTHRVSPSS